MLVAGRLLLILALAVALLGVAASLYGARGRSGRAVTLGRRALYVLAVLLAACFVLLEAAFLRSDFAFSLVATHSSTTTPAFYRATAVWSSQAGSLLLWVLLLSVWASLSLRLAHRRAGPVAPYATAVLLALAAFFCGLLVFLESPFARATPVPIDGVGLNPLLRHPSMMIHPPLLYSGYTLFTVPFAFAIGALAARRLDAQWLRLVRPFALGAWLLLGMGIVLGARWSYSELGWGGYWAWDAVENASLMPWLTGTAFLHSMMLQEKRGMLKVWNVSLVLGTGVLCVLGTFIVRSGILDSIHAFGASTLGIPFLALILTLIGGSGALVALRARDLRSEHRLDSLLSREVMFLLNNLVLVALCFVILWGTLFPLISEAATGQRAAVGPPWFGRYVVPLALVLALLSGLGPVLAWRRATAANLRRGLLAPAAAGAGTVLVLLAVGGTGHRPLALAMFGLGAFVVGVVVQELARGVRARRAATGAAVPRALAGLVQRNRRRYGGYVVHVGVAVLFVGVAASSAFQTLRDVRLAPGERARVGGYEVEYVRPTSALSIADNGRLEKLDLGAELRVRRDGETTTLQSVRSYFPSNDPRMGAVSRYFEGEATSEVGLQTGLRRDVWAVVAPDIEGMRPVIRRGDEVFAQASELPAAERAAALGEGIRRLVASYENETRPVTVRVLISPLVTWIWLGALIAFAGALLALWPRRARARGQDADLLDLTAARDAKYREIHEAELDLRTGKLSEEDWAQLDRALRTEAVGLLRKLDEAGVVDSPPGALKGSPNELDERGAHASK